MRQRKKEFHKKYSYIFSIRTFCLFSSKMEPEFQTVEALTSSKLY